MSTSRAAFDLRGLYASPVLLGSFVLAIPGWFAAFIGQCVVEAKYHSPVTVSTGGIGANGQAVVVSARAHGSAVGIGWFGIFLELVLVPAVLWTLATNSIVVHRLQLAVFLAVAIPVAVIEVNNSIYGNFSASPSASKAMGAGYLLLATSNIIWLLLLSASEDSPIFNMLGGHFAGSRGPKAVNGTRRSMIGQPFSAHRSFVADVHLDNGHSYSPPMDYKRDSGSLHSANQSHHNGLGPMMTQNAAPVTTGTAPNVDHPAPSALPSDVIAQAKALYKYNRNEEDPNEVSFEKGEILSVLDMSGKWYSVRRKDGQAGIAPSNYLQVIEA